jgi:hypothetical protein
VVLKDPLVCTPVPRPLPQLRPVQQLDDQPERQLHEDFHDPVGDQWPLQHGQMDLLEQRLEERQRESDLSTADQQTARVDEPLRLLHQDENPLKQHQDKPSVQLLHKQPPSKLHEEIHDLFGDQWPLQHGQMDLLEQRLEERQREADLTSADQQTSRVDEPPGLQHQDEDKQPTIKLHEDIHDLFGDQWPLQHGQMNLLEQRMEERQHKADLFTADQQISRVDESLETADPDKQRAMPMKEQVKIWKTMMHKEHLDWKRAEEQRRRENEERAADQRAAEVVKRTQELVVELKKLQERNRQAEKEAALWKEKKMADSLRKVLGQDGEK